MRCDCEPTYEELKLLSNEDEGTVAVDCEPTYEELKHLLFYLLEL